MVGERGIRLSGGQKQELDSKSILQKIKNLIFDEPTSALDKKTEKI